MKDINPKYFLNRLSFIGIFLLLFSCQSQNLSHSVLPRFNHTYLNVADMDRSIKFYTSSFDLEVVKHVKKIKRTTEDGVTTESDINLAFFRFPGQGFVLEVGENPEFKPENSSASLLHISVEVTDIEAAGQRVTKAGGVLVRPISRVEIEGITAKTMFFTGPDGETIELIQLISGKL
ncbi:VOC family protein [Algoriphagus aestuarii]|nr:VOC family protein [Algoriphagus aestuarii]